MEWTANIHPGTENIMGHTRSEDLNMKECLNWCTTEYYLSEYCLMMGVNLVHPNEPKMSVEAWHHPDPMQQENWQKATRKEFSSVIKQNVWQHVKKKIIPKNQRLIGSKWVFKLKHDGTYHARLVVLEYSQIPSVDFTNNFALMVNHITFCLMLSRKLIKKLSMMIIDMEMTFLWGT